MRFFHSIAQNTLFQTIARVISSGTSFVIAILVAREFGVNGYGDLAKITAFVSFFYLLVDFGYNAIYLQLAKESSKFRDLFYTRFLLSILLIVGVSIIAFTLPYSPRTGIGYSPIVKTGILLFSLTLITEGILYSTTALFQKNLTYKYTAVSAATGAVVSLLFVGVTILFSLPLLFIVLAYVFGALAESITSLALAKESLVPFSIDTRFIKTLTFQTLPITLMLLLNLVYFRVDSFLLALMKSTRDVAVYDLAYKFFDFLIALPLFLSNSIYPSLLASEKNTRNDIPKAFVYAFWFLCIGSLLVIPVWFLTPLLVFIKPDFLAASDPLRILLVSLPVFFVTNILQWMLIAKKQQKALVVIYAVSLVANISLNIIFIPHHSYIASAIITGISEALVLVLLVVYMQMMKEKI